MYKNAVLILTLICLLATSGLAVAQEPSGKQLVDKQKYEWAIEEILQQLKELNRDINGIKKDVAGLNAKLATLEKAQPAAPNQVSAPKSIKLGSNLMGSDKAKYAIIEFSDYQCSFCARHSKNVLPQIKKEFIDTGLVLYNLRDYPLSFHHAAEGAAIAARCAGEQGQYWGMHAQLHANQGKLGLAFYQESAKGLGLDKKAFDQCLMTQKKLKQVQQDLAYGNSLGVTGTPKFFVGKIKGETITEVTVISGAQQYSAFKGAIDKLAVSN